MVVSLGNCRVNRRPENERSVARARNGATSYMAADERYCDAMGTQWAIAFTKLYIRGETRETPRFDHGSVINTDGVLP